MAASRNVPFFEYPRLFKDDQKLIVDTLFEIGNRGAFILQKELSEFEVELSRFAGSQYAVGVGNATDGLELSWLAVGIQPGDEVIMSAHTMLATASAVKTVGGVPVPVEIGDDFLIDPHAIEAAITKNTVAISPTHLNGRTCDMDRIQNIAAKRNLLIVEDAAQALGSQFNGKHAGTFGQAGSISFFPAKVLGGLGDGGAVLTNSEEIHDKLYQLHDHGRDKHGDVKSWGRNSRLDNFQAALLHKKLGKYPEVINRRREIGSLYHNELKSIEQLTLPPAPSTGLHFDVFQNYELCAESRDDLRLFLKERGVGTLVQWGGKALHQWEGLGLKASLPRVEKFFEDCLMLPMNNFISNDDVLYVCEVIKSFYEK
jgi:dTDP-4-amino-4,6-dideoxygalactose transaminase